ncbi:MAG: 1-deoxy-D-xylulose-5-phosphate reductoisomerase [Gemmatimonadetes bacterium]|nr:1-deoxy-D-xylulose-5-phosphate reductoisomerase [Gemmatimonadota bacterium]
MGGRVGVAVLGSTGSVGRSTLSVLERLRDRFQVVVLTAHQNVSALAEQVERWAPDLAVLCDSDVPLPGAGPTRWVRGWEGVLGAATHPGVGIVVNAVVGAAGLEPTCAALQAGKRVALANKESLVVGGRFVLEAARRGGGELVPVDSEHSAIFQCLGGRGADAIRRLLLTASGGPFRDRDPSTLSAATPQEALRHPTWEMGAKVTVDSATLANKALEVMEAHFLFGVPYDAIEVVIHRESIVHSFAEFVDGSLLAQLSAPTMELPILYALLHPERVAYPAPRLDLAQVGALHFEALPPGRYPTFELGIEAARDGDASRIAFNAANEMSVAAFLRGDLPFTGIPQVVEAVLRRQAPAPVTDLRTALDVDREARARAQRLLPELRE